MSKQVEFTRDAYGRKKGAVETVTDKLHATLAGAKCIKPAKVEKTKPTKPAEKE